MIRLLLLFYAINELVPSIESHMKTGLIGQPCSLTTKKECILPNSQCIEGICMCSSFYTFINGTCVTDESKTLGKHCRGGGDCRGQGEFCSSFSICMCLSTHVDVGSQCKPVIYPGQFGCEDSLQCNKGFPGAECDVSRICVCPHGLVVSQQTCINADFNSTRNSIMNELMLQNVIMADHRQVNKSDFRGNFYRRKTHDSPRGYQIGPDATCSYDNQCSGYPLAICDSVCKCVKGALNTGTTCIASSTALQSSVSCPAGQTYVREAGVCMTVQQPGEPCQYSQQCSSIEPGAYCLKMRCECVYGMKKSSNGCTFVNNDCKERGHIFISEIGECREVIPPGGKGCSHNLQCSGAYPDATCFMQTCTCPPNLPVAADGTCGRSCSAGQVYSGVTGECLPEVQPGEACLYSSQCQSVFGGMVCDKNTCRCPNGLVYDGSKCSQSCPQHLRVIEREICVEACSHGNVNVNGRCMAIVQIGQSCTSNAQCNSGSSCQKGSCQCPAGQFVVNNQCQALESEPNGSCANNEKCTKGSICYNERCVCPRNQDLVNGVCQPNRAAVLAYNNALDNIRRIRMRFASHPKTNTPQKNPSSNDPIVPIGSACVRVGISCDGGSICVAGVCVCPLGKTPRNGVCINHVTATPGSTCSNGEECVENSVCNEQTMICECVNPSQMVVGNRCVERLRSHPGYGCSMGEMCVGNSVCVNAKCECAQGKVEVNKICIEPTYGNIGDKCGRSVVCQNGSYCNNDSGICACPKGQKEIRGECKQVTLVYPGEVCTDVTSRCAGGSYCVHGRCECPFSMQLVDRKCVLQKSVYPGDVCNENTICSGSSVCKDGKCACINEMVVRDKNCVHRRKVKIGNSCDKFDMCLGNSTCVEDYCQCPVGHVTSGDICELRRTVAPGYLCSPEDICTGQSVCIKGVCQCKPNYKQMHSICVKNNIGVEGSACVSREDCGDGLACHNSVCSCPENMFAVGGKCRSYVRLGHTCTTDDRCGDRNAACIENACFCKAGYVNNNGECMVQIVTPVEPETMHHVKAGHIGHFCATDEECRINHTHCRRNVCICKEGYRIFGSTQCIPRVAKPKPKVLQKEKLSENSTESPISKTAELGEDCNRLAICQRGAICSNGKCVCPRGFVEQDGACTKSNANIKVVVPPLSSCINGEVCSGNSECIHGICFCKEEFTLFHGKCQTLKKVENLRVLESKGVLSSTVATISNPDTKTPSSVKTPFTSQPIVTTTPSSLKPVTPIIISVKVTPVNQSTKLPETSPNPHISTPWFKIVKPGRPCDSLSYCTNCSVCISGFCVCPEGLELYEEKCVSHVDAQRCVASNQCPSGANCVRGECQCKPGLGLSRLGFCIPINYADPGTSCANGEKCRSESHCIDGICVCNDPLMLKENKCVRSMRAKRFINNSHRKLLRFTPKKKAGLGEYCFRDEHCESQKKCTKGFCKCPKNFVQSAFSCVPRMSVISTLAMPGESCRSDFCTGGSVCTSFVCKCPPEYYKQGDSCVRLEARIGTPCGLTTDCSSGSQCVSSFCQCQDQYDADLDECYPIESYAAKRKNVKSSIPKKANRVVSASTVNCPIGYDLVNGMCVNSETLSVIQLSEPGGACEDGRVLCTGNSVCASNVCICPNGETVQNGTCISISSLSAPGETCDLINTVCTGNSICIDGLCKCPTTQGALNGRCTVIGGGIGCSQKQCGMNQICVMDMCQCRPGYAQQPGSCVADRCNCVMAQGATCGNTQCGMNQVCVQDQCRCRTGYYQQADSCVNDACNCIIAQDDGDAACGQSQCGMNQLCVQDQCQCKPGYYQPAGTCQNDRCNCVQQSSAILAPRTCVGNGCSPAQSFSPFFGLPGQMCDMRRDAITCRNQALCISNQCVCPSDKVLSGSDCVRYLGDALPGQNCNTVGIICRGGSSCNQNVCQCQNGLVPNGDSCGPNIEFRFNVIQPALTTQSQPQPIFDLNPGQSCNPNCASQPCLQRCSGGSVCSNSVCTCPQGSYVYNSICTPNQPIADAINYTRTARPGDSCDISIVCIGGSSCIIGTCSCDSGYTPSFDRTSCVLIDRMSMSLKARSYPKTFCTFDNDCKDGAICIDKRCSCRQTEEMINGKCKVANQPGARCHTSYCSKGAECQNGYCVCSKTQLSNSSRDCIPALSNSVTSNLAYPGSKCNKNTVCQDGSTCIFNYCVIPSDDSDREYASNINTNTIAQIDSNNNKIQKRSCINYKDCGKMQTCSSVGICECPFSTNMINGECINRL